MVKSTQAIQSANGSLRHSVDQLCRLQPDTQALVASLISRLAEAEGVSISIDHKLPTENLELWITKLKAERKAEKTIRLYSYLARRFLRQIPEPARAGIESFTPHQLRHLYATEMLRSGAKLEVVGRILGHASIGITADIYRHVSRGEMHEENGRFAPFNGNKTLT